MSMLTSRRSRSIARGRSSNMRRPSAAAARSPRRVKADRWRILVGDDPQSRQRVQQSPDKAYRRSSIKTLRRGGWRFVINSHPRDGCANTLVTRREWPAQSGTRRRGMLPQKQKSSAPCVEIGQRLAVSLSSNNEQGWRFRPGAIAAVFFRSRRHCSIGTALWGRIWRRGPLPSSRVLKYWSGALRPRR